MDTRDDAQPEFVIGPLREPMTVDALPPPGTTRWVARRKAEVVVAIEGGLQTTDEMMERYNLSLEELVSWQRAFDRSGMVGLRVTRLQLYRDRYRRMQQY